MKKTTRNLALALGTVIAVGSIAPAIAEAESRVISRVGAEERTVYAGREFELEVAKKGDIVDDKLEWTIKDTKIVRFDDDDRFDDDIELRAVKAGTTTVTCKNLLTGKSVSYKIVVNEKPQLPAASAETKNDKPSLTTETVKTEEAPAEKAVQTETKSAGEAKKKETKSSAQTVQKTEYTFSAVGSTTRTIESDDDAELRIKKSESLKSSQTVWSIANTSILRFENGDNKGNEVEVEALKTGTTTVTAKDSTTGKKVVFTIKVVADTPDRDDDRDEVEKEAKKEEPKKEEVKKEVKEEPKKVDRDDDRDDRDDDRDDRDDRDDD